MKRILLTAIVMLLLPSAGVMAGSGKGGKIPAGAVYRFTDENGNTEISSSLSEEAIQQGYEVLNRKGRVIKEVAPALTEEERRELKEKKRRQREKERQKERDKKLLRLYAGPEDARRARDRQIKALEVNISYTKNSLQQVKQKLEREVSRAAKFEQRGEEVPPSVEESITRFQNRIEEHKQEIEGYRQDIADVRRKFKPIIDRLRVIAPPEPEKRRQEESGQKQRGDGNDGESVPIPSPTPGPE